MSYLSRIADTLGVEGTSSADVLIAEDEEMVAEMFESWLSDAGFSVRVATGGEEALRRVDGDVDVVLLDRRMPLVTGDEVLDVIRSEDIERLDPEAFEDRDPERITEEYESKGVEDIDLDTARKLDDEMVRGLQEAEIDCQVCMITAIEPDSDIVELDFDHYVVKDVNESQLVSIVGSLASLSELDETVRKYQSLRWKMFLVEQACPRSELEENEKYQELKRLMREVEEREGKRIRKVKQIDFR